MGTPSQAIPNLNYYTFVEQYIGYDIMCGHLTYGNV